MKNATKAVIAGVAGIALLTGGAGSLAYWQQTQNGSSVSITSGTLSFGTFSDSTGWMLQQNAANVVPAQTNASAVVYSGQKIVPGDVLTKTISVPVNITGQNNRATFTLGQVTPATSGLDGVLNIATTVNGSASPTANILASGGASQTVTVTVTITFPWGSADLTTNTQNQTTAFQAKYTLTQVPIGN
jgi:alternate signal-mediated exported protein